MAILLFVTYPKSSHLPDSKVHGANMGPIWGRQDPGGPHVDPMIFAIWAWLVYVMLAASPKATHVCVFCLFVSNNPLCLCHVQMYNTLIEMSASFI